MRSLSDNSRRAFLLLILAVLPCMSAIAQIPHRPQPPRLVNDFASVLTSEQRMELERTLVAFDDTTSNQIAVLFVDGFGGLDISSFAIELGREWGIGREEYDNGIVVVVKPKAGNERGQAFIAVGYGLEGAIPDIAAHRIVDDVMIPRFIEGDYYRGVSDAVSLLMKLASGEISVADIEEGDSGGALGVIIVLIILFIVSLAISGRRHRNGGSDTFTGGGHSTGAFPPIFFGCFGGGGGHSGGFGGGGFGGFGGGSFGGGGAGGSW